MSEEIKIGFWQKIKLLSWAWALLRKVQTMKKLWDVLSGYKSVFGLLGVVGYYVAKQFGVDVPEMVLDASYGLLGVGLVHKLDKATGIITKVIEVLLAVLKVLDKKKSEEK